MGKNKGKPRKSNVASKKADKQPTAGEGAPSGESAAAKEDEQPIADWWIYTGQGKIIEQTYTDWPKAPQWRTFKGEVPENPRAIPAEIEFEKRFGAQNKGSRFRADKSVIEMVNAAIYLRRPLLVTGKPGTGKSTLVYSIAYELGLNKVLVWQINSRSTRREGLYEYDAIGRLQEANLFGPNPDQDDNGGKSESSVPAIGKYLRLGPVGTALLPAKIPRVLLIDEIDKADIDLPNDLLHIFETGTFEIPELARIPKEQQPTYVRPSDSVNDEDTVPINEGRVTCSAFPIVILTSNGEREFPPAFLRRCLRLDITQPSDTQLLKIVKSQLNDRLKAAEGLVGKFLEKRKRGDLATDQFLNALYLVTREDGSLDEEREHLVDKIWRFLDRNESENE